jgi:hypothetical protein
MNAPASAAIALQPPALGAPWPEQGGIYAGLVRGIDGEPDYHLIVGAEAAETLTWKKASAWAKGLQEHGFADYVLPDRREQRFLFVQVKELFQEDWYWSSTQYAGDAAYAWCQNFYNGNQHARHKGTELRARAVRRLPI